MNEQEIIETVNASLAEEFELDAAKMLPAATLYDDLGLDSLDAVDMVIVLEKAFGFKMRDNDAIRSFRSLGDIHRFIIDRQRELQA